MPRNGRISSSISVAVLLLAFETISFAASHKGTSSVVTSVEGPSNLDRLGLTIETSAMGRTGAWGPPPESPYAVPPLDVGYFERTSGPVTVTGADLYRMNCQACHQANGTGVPPEINAIIGPVQATSAILMERRMRDMGRPITATFARELATGSIKDLRDRLKNGGQKMPSFGYLTPAEVNALISYLDLLAGLPGSERQATVNEPVMRVGELLVKGTCHICHDATGSWPDPEQLLQGSIPPIAGFTSQKSMPQFIGKVRHGAPVVMGSLRLAYRGRMPVFNYLSDDEVSAAYLYLLHYQPR
jgi:mono/diheme cytochrome c family protein